MFLADHVLVPDKVFDCLARDRGADRLRSEAQRQLQYRELIEAGLVVPVPNNVAMALRGDAAYTLTAEDVNDPSLVEWVKSQLIFEGPTAREVLFVTARDDHEKWPQFWLHGHINRDSLDKEERTFRTMMLQPYSSDYDYGPWKNQVTDDAVSYYIQRLNERVTTADVFAAEYVTSSPFEARLLSRKKHTLSSAAQAALWADIPVLRDADVSALARAASQDEAVADLRAQVRTAMMSARSLESRIDVLSEKAHSINDSAAMLERTIRTDRTWQLVAPSGAGLAGIAIGFFGGIPGVAAGAIGAFSGLAPFLATRRSHKRDAAYLFVCARRGSHRHRK
ncbi:hypothetical protein [Kribbella sp. NPDC051137]|uniref:hypothetical protein n=1 Tax=Kribbella sp. NPDC051137 TaxID=3155045 RepID=UPI00342D5C16